ncbi:hypothetical protein [Asanoa iriomotensis]|uniref:Secreted protein n=1 Tax=Asanoa iriomotensis TaxID=234613 RepID=A0ABQ4BYC3_9ACTN|nr:hypothetical protein [Asanoa iriomotensis]GIF55546.1 hypothetical protein Air01nite_16410 [Asanoa iriomotensis]
MDLVVAQLPALIGVIVGALATYVVTARMERDKWLRHQQSRWDERRIAAYSDYALTVKAYVTILRRIAGSMGLDDVAHPIGREEGVPLADAAEEDRSGKFENVLLLGDEATIRAARTWHRAAWELAYLVQGRKKGGAEDWRQALDGVWAAREDFYTAVRADLGVRPTPAQRGVQPLGRSDGGQTYGRSGGTSPKIGP